MSTTTRLLVTFLSSFCVVWIQIECVLASITCSTSGELNSTCHPSGSCYEDQSVQEQLGECEKEPINVNKTVSFAGYNVTECERYSDGVVFYHCNAVGQGLTSFPVSGIDHNVVALDASYFTMNVSWTWNESDFNLANGQIWGYELRIYRADKTVKCLCLWEPSLRTISLGFDPVLQYRASMQMQIILFTLPYQSDWDPTYYSKTVRNSWPLKCNNYDIFSANTFCPVTLPAAPVLVNVRSLLFADGTKELNVLWTKTNSVPSPSEMYYARVFDNLNNETLNFVVKGSRNVTISRLHSNTNYSVGVQGYSFCSGLSSFYSNNFSGGIGCGIWSEAMDESVHVPTTTSFQFFPAGTTRVTPLHRQPDHIPIISSAVTLVCLFLLAFLLCTLFLLYHKKRALPVVPIYLDFEDSGLQVDVQIKPEKLDALVLYSEGSPTSEKIEIEKYIVGFLKQERLEVLSCNNHTEKTVVQWVEENARSAHAVFIVCNKQFCKEWTMQSRSQLINSLEMIIASAVGQKTIKKYATILLRSEDEQFIPNNLYLKGMKSFVMGSHATQDDRAHFISFIKLNRILK